MNEELVGGRIARLAQRFARHIARIAHDQQQSPRDFGKTGGKVSIIGNGHIVGIHVVPSSASTINSAASSGATRVVSTRISGFSGVS